MTGYTSIAYTFQQDKPSVDDFPQYLQTFHPPLITLESLF